MSTEPSFWQNVLRATEAEPKNESVIRGASGIHHSVVALGVDESRRRLLIVSGEHDARTAAMAQIDIQASLDKFQVLVARPVAFDLPAVAKTIAALSGRTRFLLEDISKFDAKSGTFRTIIQEHFGEVLAPLDFLGRIPFNTLAQWMQVIQQLALIQFSMSDSQDKGTISIDLGALASLEALERDNHFGICPVPLYEFMPDEIEKLNSGTNLDSVREILRNHGLLQYFFPSPDQVALGLIDRGVTSGEDVLEGVLRVPEIGHPYGAMELVGRSVTVPDMIEALQDRGLAVEGELGWELGAEGRNVRTTVRFRPREGLLSKLINRFSFGVDLKDFFKPK